MSFTDTAFILKFHHSCLQRSGSGNAKTLGWEGEEVQKIRFEVLSQIGDLNNCSILDAGCGYGDLNAFLDGKFKNIRYSGIDLIEPFVEEAVKRYGEYPDATFYSGDFSTAELPLHDYVLASGSLNYRNSDPVYITNAITSLFQFSKIALGFNLLSKVDIPDGALVAYAPEFILKHCKTLTTDVVLKTDYLEGDYTVMMYR